MIVYLLQQIREQKGIKQIDLSKNSGVSISMINAIEHQNRNPTIPILNKLATSLHVKITELYINKNF